MSTTKGTTADWEAMREILASIAIGPVGSRDLSRADAKRAMTLALSGEVSDVRASVTAGAQSAEERGHLARHVIVPRPHVDLVRHL